MGLALCFLSLFAQFGQGGQGRLAFRIFLALTLTACKLHSAMMHRTFKDAIMVRSSSGGHPILGRFRRHRLQKLLQFTFRIFQDGQRRELAKGALELIQNKFPRSLEASVKKDCPQQSLESVRQRSRPLAPAVQFLSTAYDQMTTQPEVPGPLSQCPPTYQLDPGSGEWSLTE